MRQTEQDGEHIWLRQSVTFTANGQTRTVEMAIPLRPGAPAEEIERLLNEAEAGMRRLSTRLDSHVAALLDDTSSSASAPAAIPAPTPVPASPSSAPAPAATLSPAAPETPRPAAASPSPAPSTPSRPAASARSTPPTAPAPARARSSGSLAPAGASSATAATSAEDLSIKDFLAAAGELDLNARQAMERLGVRSLAGLHLREALEVLRRQVLRDGDTAPAPPMPTASSKPPARAPAPEPPRYFEEEDDDHDITFTVDGDDALAEEFGPYEAEGIPAGAPAEDTADLDALDALDELDLDDVPDFGPPPSAAHSTRAARPSASARNNTPAKAAPAPPPAPIAPDEPAVDEPATSPARQRIAQLRAIRGGGTPTTHQRAAYRNVVLSELGEPETVALVRGLWRSAPERLGPEQLDALISWGKQDTFAEEAADVLAVLRAARQQAAAATADETPPAPSAPSRPAPRGSRAAPAPRPSSGGR